MNKLNILIAGLTPVLASLTFSPNLSAKTPAPPAKAKLTVVVNPTSLAENSGTKTATGTVTRSRSTTGNLRVLLQSTDTSEARVPASVTIPAGATSVTFPVTAVPDNMVDGTRKLHIVATSTGFAPGRVLIQVTDATAGVLRLRVTPRRFKENAGAAAATGTVTRNTATTAALTVTLTSTDTSEARVPATVTIPVGAASATFAISAVQDKVRSKQGMTRLHIVASAPNMTSARAQIVVMDNR